MNAIVMTDNNGCIGVDNNQPIHLRQDLSRFQRLTTDKIVICGSTTLKTFPKGLPLAHRSTIIISSKLKTHDFSYITNRNITVYNNIQDVIMLQAHVNPNDLFVIGGASVYKQLINYIDNIYMTKVDTDFEFNFNLDSSIKTYFPEVINHDFEIKDSKECHDQDMKTQKSYYTEFIHYQRYNNILFDEL